MISPSERQQLLADLNTLAVRDLVEVWRRASVLDADFAAFIRDAFPEIAVAYAGVAADMAVDWYEQSDPESDFRARAAAPPSLTALESSTSWALGAAGTDALGRLSGTLQRAVFDGARNTISDNVTREGSRWVRHASANACEFCKLLATRHIGPNATFFSSAAAAESVVGRGKEMSAADRRDRAAGRTRRSGSGSQGQFLAGGRRARGTQSIGDKYHDHCHCVAVEIRAGQTYTPPPYVEKWNDDYIAARKASGSGDPKKILAAWRQL
ncbi:hypothetical protein JTZ10_21670 [Gordonia rubripertincta]|uniref:Capsid maturation protease n=1 Tax=Gordonia rubripertincta TaxID=36822 RepID=A0AAW4G9V7_GORRU|nr:hypothetical protein [Gordonia rubripertincta]MBM7280357.1 hypothetical protein [Gordonia rubripertincta]